MRHEVATSPLRLLATTRFSELTIQEAGVGIHKSETSMVKTRERIARIRTGVAELMTRLRVYLDERAEKDKAGWGSHMEYRRRYTNPDAAKRARTPPGELKEERRRTPRGDA